MHLGFCHLDTDETKRILAHIQKARGAPFSEIWLTMLHHPKLTEKVSDLGQLFRFEGALPGNVREAAILYIAKRCHATYEWAAHSQPAKKEGVSPEVIALIEKGKPFSDFPEPYRTPLEAAQAAFDKRSLPETCQAKLLSLYEKKGLVEIVLLAGYYQMLASFLNAFDVTVLGDVS